jgi:deoxyhypusine synthase
MPLQEVSAFIKRTFRHFNAGTLVDAAEAYYQLMLGGGKMMVAMAGAMSTAEIGITLAEMIRKNKVHALSVTGANLEEDLFNLVGHKSYERDPDYEDLTPAEEEKIFKGGKYRVTDTLMPDDAMQAVEDVVFKEWQRMESKGERLFPHEVLYRLIKQGAFAKKYQIDPRDSWLVAACEKNLPMVVPGWEDSTLGNAYAAEVIKGKLKDPNTIRNGIEYMIELAHWYAKTGGKIGFFQIGGGIAGDFPICVVPLIKIELKRDKTPLWAYFCQISDSTTSYGSYSGALPNEKITWGKIGKDTPGFIIESDATIVFPLIAAYVLAPHGPPAPPIERE